MHGSLEVTGLPRIYLLGAEAVPEREPCLREESSGDEESVHCW